MIGEEKRRDDRSREERRGGERRGEENMGVVILGPYLPCIHVIVSCQDNIFDHCHHFQASRANIWNGVGVGGHFCHNGRASLHQYPPPLPLSLSFTNQISNYTSRPFMITPPPHPHPIYMHTLTKTCLLSIYTTPKNRVKKKVQPISVYELPLVRGWISYYG